jgi:hypothetical protein
MNEETQSHPPELRHKKNTRDAVESAIDRSKNSTTGTWGSRRQVGDTNRWTENARADSETSNREARARSLRERRSGC